MVDSETKMSKNQQLDWEMLVPEKKIKQVIAFALVAVDPKSRKAIMIHTTTQTLDRDLALVEDSALRHLVEKRMIGPSKWYKVLEQQAKQAADTGAKDLCLRYFPTANHPLSRDTELQQIIIQYAVPFDSIGYMATLAKNSPWFESLAGRLLTACVQKDGGYTFSSSVSLATQPLDSCRRARMEVHFVQELF